VTFKIPDVEALIPNVTIFRNRTFIYLFFLKIVSIYLTEREHKQREQQTEEEGEADSPRSREPDVWADPRTLGS